MKAIRSKYTFMIILSAAGLLTGCNKMTPDSGPADIAFDVSEDWQLATKSLASSDADLQTKSFSVLGKYSSGDTYDASSLSTVFNNQEVRYDTSDWVYEPIQQWNRSSTYRFCAYWPMDNNMSLTGDLDGTIKLTGFIGQNLAANHTDLMLSSVKQQIVNSNPRQMSETSGNMLHDGVTLEFHHLLCNIKVAVKKEGETEIHVTSVQLVNTPNEGDFSTTYSSWNATPPSGTWTVDPDGMTEYNSGTTDVELSDVYQTIWSDGFLVIPQTVNTKEVSETNKVYIRVRFTSKKDGVTTNKSYEIALPDDSAWPMFKKITYQLTIDENDYIKFGTPVVEPWGTPQASGTIIIR